MIIIRKLTPSVRTVGVFSKPHLISCYNFRPSLLKLQQNGVIFYSSISSSVVRHPTLQFGCHSRRSQVVLQKSHFTTTSSRLYASESQDKQKLSSAEHDVRSEDNETETSARGESDLPPSSTNEDVESSPNALTPEEIKTLSGGDPQLEHKIQFILMEVELMRQVGSRVPDKITMKYWPELLNLQSKGQRIKYYLYLWNVEKAQISDKRRKEEKRLQRLAMYAENPLPTIEDDPYGMVYGLNRNAITLRLYDTTIAAFHHHRVISEMVLGSAPLVLDFGYEDQMVIREAKNCASQVELLLTENRTHPQPFNLSFCNADPNSNTITHLRKRIPTMYDDNYALNISEKSYLDLYPREKLVYLSPHAREELTEFDHDEIYIIGAIVDKTDPRPFSIAKAKKEGIRMKKLPLDSRVDWGMGNKSLTINQMISIMLEIRATGDWDKALRFIPRRKLVGGRMECPLPDPDAVPKRRSSGPQAQVFKDFELVAQRRRGFVYQGAQDDQRHGNNDDSNVRQRQNPNPYKGRQQGYGHRPHMRSIMSDLD